MDIRHLRYVIALAEELHFGRAAKRLHVSQPPLSQQLMKLEEELGVKLFERTKHTVALTAAGVAFVAEARSVLTRVDHAAAVAARSSESEVEHLKIGTLTSTESGFYRVLIKVLERFTRQFPNVRVGLSTMTTPQQIRALKDDRIQIGFGAIPIDDPAVAVVPIYSEPFGLALPDGHLLASQASVSASALASQRQIDFPRDAKYGGGLYAKGDFRRRHGFRINVLHEARTVYDSLVLVSAGLGVFLVPASFGDVPRKGIVIRKLKPSSLLRMGVMYRKDNQSPGLLSFLTVLEERPKK